MTSIQAATSTATIVVRRQGVMNQAGPDCQFGREDLVATPFLSEVRNPMAGSQPS